MEIIILGNGFDLAHKLPTQYKDFLKFVDVIKQVIGIKNSEELKQIDWMEINTEIKEIIEYNMGKVSGNLFHLQEIWKELFNDNTWIEYFLQCNMYQKENWIDFENEISHVIKELDGNKGEDNLEENIIALSNKFFSDKYLNTQQEKLAAFYGSKMGNKKIPITYGQLLEILKNDLARLIRALEIYLTDYVEKIIIYDEISEIAELTPDRVFLFNYTSTYEKVYGKKKTVIEYDYIHGKADIKSNVESSNLVLGIDEYLDDSRKNKDVEFIAFKKYFQRIYKETGNDYKLWIDEIKEEWNDTSTDSKREIRRRISENNFNNTSEKIHKLYIFGHSLDITDADVLRSFILNENVKTTIYYYRKDENDKTELKKQIANLVKIIGQDELIKRTGGRSKTIEFVPQSITKTHKKW